MPNILKRIFLPKDKPSGLSLNTVIYQDIQSCFSENIEILSVGNRMLYPTSFNILLHPDDYSKVEQSLPFILQEVTNKFYFIIKGKNKKYSNIDPPSTHWFFQFSPCAELVFPPNALRSTNIENTVIEGGQPFILCSLYSTEIGKGNTQTVANVKMSLKPKNSMTYETVDINPGALKGIDSIGKGIYRIPINMQFAPDTKLPVSDGHVYAQIRFTDQDGSKIFSMVDKEIIISQKGEESPIQTNFLYINHPAVQQSHARIRYVSSNDTFMIAAFGSVKLNGALLPASPNNEPQWVLLTDGAKIMIGNPGQLPIQLSFSMEKTPGKAPAVQAAF